MNTRIPLCRALFASALLFAAGPSGAAELKVLVAPELEAAIDPLATAFGREKGHQVLVDTAGRKGMRKARDNPGTADVVIGGASQFDPTQNKDSTTPAERRDLGRTGLGVFVRTGARVPVITSADAFGKSLLAANGVVYGSGPSGRGVAKALQTLNLTAELQAKTTRLADREEIFDFVLRSTGDEIGIALIPEILANTGPKLKYVGPVPAELQDYVRYSAFVLKSARAPAAAKAFVEYLATPAAKAKLAAAGVE
jgi:molybdate transport system substrate-binding protein